jgi:hypothetical protein
MTTVLHFQQTERIPVAAKRLDTTTRHLYGLIDSGLLSAVRTSDGHLEVDVTVKLPNDRSDPNANSQPPKD